MTWETDLSSPWDSSSSYTTLELHLVPPTPQRIEVRRLASLKDELVTIGRQGGLFSPTEELESDATANFTFARSTDGRHGSGAGLVVTLDGQRGVWITLPHDSMGSVLDIADVTPRMAALLNLLVHVDVPMPAVFAVTAALRSTLMLTVGSVDVVGRRSSASMHLTSDDIVLPLEDGVRTDQIALHADQIAEELIARLSAQLRARH